MIEGTTLTFETICKLEEIGNIVFTFIFFILSFYFYRKTKNNAIFLLTIGLLTCCIGYCLFFISPYLIMNIYNQGIIRFILSSSNIVKSIGFILTAIGLAKYIFQDKIKHP